MEQIGPLSTLDTVSNKRRHLDTLYTTLGKIALNSMI